MARQKLEIWADSGYARVWDEDYQLVHVFSVDELSTEGDGRVSESLADERFAKWMLGQFLPQAYMTIDRPDGRWFGKLGGFAVKNEGGKAVLRAGWLSCDTPPAAR